LTRCETHGLEKLPRSGSTLLVANHLGDADFIVGVAFTPRMVDALAKSELYDFPLIGWILDAYGVIWLHRGLPDRRALHAALDGLARGRCVAIAPEGRESVSGSLEEGMGGAAYLAFKSGVNLVPVTFTGTENARVYRNLKHLKRTHVSLTIGEPFELENTGNRREDIRRGTEEIMTRLADQLPPEYRGIYAKVGETQQ
jgi:1-acyl-sn-glycerol-3-phosphate acyltransferase